MIRLYNEASTAKLEVDITEPFCNRGKLDTGTHCNYKCSFCYYIDQLNVRTPYETIIERVDYLVDCGITEVDLSGGESSIHKDWFKILDYCKSKGLKISTLSNGYKFADYDFIEKSKEHGLEEILFSLHGYDEDSHNKMVGSKHGFTNIIEAIRNAHSLDMLVRVNCTVQKENYKELSTKFVELMKQLKPFEVNFITLNYWDDADRNETIDYNHITPEIHKAIDQLKDDIEIINVRYTPYCFMKGYEEYVCNYYQHIYDVYDWNIAVYDQRLEPEMYKGNELEYLYESAKQNRLLSYYKKKECLGCKHYFICDGIENQIKEIELHPETVESEDRITDVNEYRKDYYGRRGITRNK